MFCEVMYSSACQRVTRFMRLPTFALPAMRPRLWVVETLRQRADCLRREQRVSIERDYDLALCVTQTEVQRRPFPMLASEQPHSLFVSKFLLLTTLLVLSCEPSSITMISKLE